MTEPQPPTPDTTDAFPWGGLLTLLALVVIEVAVLGPHAPHSLWPELLQDPDYVTLERLEESPSLILLGNSRAQTLQPNPAQQRQLGVARVLPLWHGGAAPLDALARARLLADRPPSKVTWELSIFETHRPLLFQTNNQHGQPPLQLATLLDLFRVRRVPWRSTGLHHLTAYWLSATVRRRAAWRDTALGPALHWTQRDALLPTRRPDAGFERLRAQHAPHLPPATFNQQLRSIRKVRPGPHSTRNTTLYEAALRILHRSGHDVVVYEAPLHPAFPIAEQARMRDELHGWLRRLEREGLLRFVPLEASSEIPASMFRDLTHLNATGQATITERVVTTWQEEP